MSTSTAPTAFALGGFADSLWVLNNTDSIVTIEVRVDGNAETIRVPKTWVPVDLTIQASLADLTKSPHLKRAFASEIISAPTEEEYNAIMKRPGAREEAQRIAANIHTANSVDKSLLGKRDSDAVIEEKQVEAKASATDAQVEIAMFRSYQKGERVGKFYMLANQDKATLEVCQGLLALATETEDKDLFDAVEAHVKGK